VLDCRVHDGYDALDLHWDVAAGQVIARRNNRELVRGSTPAIANEVRLAWGVCDRQLFFVLNEQVMLRHELEVVSKAAEPSSSPLALAVSGTGDCRLRDLQVFRDVFYLDAQGRSGQWQSSPLGVDEYGLLGDNPPLSVDSRQWGRGVPFSTLLGKVFPRW
jgi:hypothetical protein